MEEEAEMGRLRLRVRESPAAVVEVVVEVKEKKKKKKKKRRKKKKKKRKEKKKERKKRRKEKERSSKCRQSPLILLPAATSVFCSPSTPSIELLTASSEPELELSIVLFTVVPCDPSIECAD